MEHVDLKNMKKPFIVKLGFTKLIDQFEDTAANGKDGDAELANNVLAKLKDRDALYDGFDVAQGIKDHREDINTLLNTLFFRPLTKNEIKVALPPMSTEILYHSERFCSIFGDAEEIAHKEFGSISEDSAYIMMCTFILAMYYGKPVGISVPSVYDIDDESGITKYYKSLYNADFMAFAPIGKAPEITNEMVIKLSDNFDDINMWQELFPPGSWEISGFGLKSFVHISGEESISRIKDLLIQDTSTNNTAEFRLRMNSYMSTLLDVPDVKASFIMYDQNTGQFLRTKEDDDSFALKDMQVCDKTNLMCQSGLDTIFNQRKDFVVIDIDKVPDEALGINIYNNLKDQGIKSYIMTPLYDGDNLLGVIEFASTINGAFNRSLN